jgi:hypothetical protein
LIQFHASILAGEQSSSPTPHRGDGKRCVVRADEKLTAFLELESTIRAGGNYG